MQSQCCLNSPPLFELGVEAVSALDLTNRTACLVNLRCHEYYLVPRLEVLWDLDSRSRRTSIPYSRDSFSCCCCCCSRCPAPRPPHSPLPRSAVLPWLLTPIPAGDSVPTGIDGKSPANSGSQASSLCVPLPYSVLATDSWRFLGADRAAFRIPFVLPTRFWGCISKPSIIEAPRRDETLCSDILLDAAVNAVVAGAVQQGWCQATSMVGRPPYWISGRFILTPELVRNCNE